MAVEVHKIVLGTATAHRSAESPAPRFSPRCICCDATRVEQWPYDAADYPDRIMVPLCSSCRRHVSRRPALDTLLFALPVGLGAFLLLAALVLPSMALLAAGLVLIIVPIVLGVVSHRAQLAAADHGHHRMFHIGVGSGSTVVVTTNARLRDELLAQGGRPLQRRGE